MCIEVGTAINVFHLVTRVEPKIRREGIDSNAFSNILAEGLDGFTQTFLAHQQWPKLVYEKFLYFLK
jgi:hypothetical protein